LGRKIIWQKNESLQMIVFLTFLFFPIFLPFNLPAQFLLTETCMLAYHPAPHTLVKLRNES
jgi:4-amino-4-deoxy-L-arabinose transferase-like glycosyltransferase